MKKLLILILAFVFYFFIIELICRVWVPIKSDALQRAAVLLKTDNELIWRQKFNLNTDFEKTNVVTDEFGFRQSKYKKTDLLQSDILVLGPSSAFGWGVEYEDTYSNLIQNETSFKVFNAAQIGFGVEQGARLWEQLNKTKQFKYVIVAYGVNDIDRFRFFGANGLSDDEFFKLPKDTWFNYIEKANTASVFLSLLSRALSEFYAIWPCPPTAIPELRVKPDVWVKKIDTLAQNISNSGAVPILLSSAFFFNKPADSELAGKSDDLYQQSSQEAKNGLCSEARSHFLQARQFEPYRIQRDINLINDELETLQPKHIVVNIHKLLKIKEDFIDPIHPSQAGHIKIARALTHTVLK